MRFLSVCFVVCFAAFGAGCKMLDIGPSKADPDWPGGDSWGEKPVMVNQTVTIVSPSGNVNVFIEKMTPHEGGSAHVGQKGQIWAVVSNDSQKFLAIRKSVSKGPDDRPGELGDPSNLFDIHGLRIFKPGETREEIFGFQILQPEVIPFLRLSGNYETKTLPDGRVNFQIGPWTKPEWTKDIHLGWNLTP